MIKESPEGLREARASRGDLIVREVDPPNLEMPFATLDGFTTPNESFYVRCHFAIPEIAERDWSLSIEGAIENPFQLRLRRAGRDGIAHHLRDAGMRRK